MKLLFFSSWFYLYILFIYLSKDLAMGQLFTKGIEVGELMEKHVQILFQLRKPGQKIVSHILNSDKNLLTNKK